MTKKTVGKGYQPKPQIPPSKPKPSSGYQPTTTGDNPANPPKPPKKD